MLDVSLISEAFIGAFFAFLFMYLFYRISQGSENRKAHIYGLKALFTNFNHIHCVLDSNVFMMKAIAKGNLKNKQKGEVHYPMNRLEALKYDLQLTNPIRDTALVNLVFRQYMYLDSLNTDIIRINRQLDQLEHAMTAGTIREEIYKINLENLVAQFPIVIPYCQTQMTECAEILGHITARSKRDNRWYNRWMQRVSRSNISPADIASAIEEIKRSISDVTQANRDRIQRIENSIE